MWLFTKKKKKKGRGLDLWSSRSTSSRQMIAEKPSLIQAWLQYQHPTIIYFTLQMTHSFSWNASKVCRYGEMKVDRAFSQYLKGAFPLHSCHKCLSPWVELPQRVACTVQPHISPETSLQLCLPSLVLPRDMVAMLGALPEMYYPSTVLLLFWSSSLSAPLTYFGLSLFPLCTYVYSLFCSSPVALLSSLTSSITEVMETILQALKMKYI